jgi:hypothetical protein
MRSVLGGALLLVAAGCGGGSTTEKTATQDEVFTESIRLACEHAFECCMDPATRDQLLGFLAPAPQSVGECTTALTAHVADLRTQWAEAVTAGRMSFDGVVAARCIAAMERATCASFGQVSDVAVCGGVFVGLVPNGEACQDVVECAVDGVICDGLTDTAAGTCRNRFDLDDDCTPGADQCGPLLYCAETTMKCTATKDVGMSCLSNAECTSGLCDTENSTFTCLEAPPTPEPVTCAPEPADAGVSDVDAGDLPDAGT